MIESALRADQLALATFEQSSAVHAIQPVVINVRSAGLVRRFAVFDLVFARLFHLSRYEIRAPGVATRRAAEERSLSP
jgi:hypothetical protein